MTETKQIERKLRICANKKCRKCDLSVHFAPHDCEWLMKHILDADPEGIVINRPRRDGKTSDIIRRAYEMNKGGYETIILVPNSMMAQNLQRLLMGSGVEVLAVRDRYAVSRSLMGKKKAQVFSDELPEWIADAVNKDTGHNFVLGYHTK